MQNCLVQLLLSTFTLRLLIIFPTVTVKKLKFKWSLKWIRLHHFFMPLQHTLTCSTLLLICSILTVPLPVASPWQRNTFTGRPSTVELLWWTCLSACGEGAEVKKQQGEEGGKKQRWQRKWTVDEKNRGEMEAERDTEGRQGESNER